MNGTTETAINALLAADPTITKQQAADVRRILGGGEMPRPIGRVLRTTEAARLLGVTTKTLRLWAKAGALESVYAGANKLRTGYTEASVRALAEGGRKAV
jgi:hypothetical protein